MIEGFLFFYSFGGPLIALSSMLLSLMALIKSIVEIYFTTWEYRIPQGVDYAAVILAAFGSISQLIASTFRKSQYEYQLDILPPLFNESLIGFSILFLLVTIILRRSNSLD